MRVRGWRKERLGKGAGACCVCLCQGFTLVELLVSVAVIALLAVLLSSALPQVRGRAQTAACASNLRQVSVALASYAADSDLQFPPTAKWYNFNSMLDELRRYSYLNEAALYCPTVKGWQYCENFNGIANQAGDYINRVSQPSQFIVVAECTGGAWGYAFDWGIDPNRIRFDSDPAAIQGTKGGTGLSTCHQKGSNFLFADGHVQWFCAGSPVGYDGTSGGEWRHYWSATP